MVKCRTTDSLCSSPNSIKIEFAIDKRSHHNRVFVQPYYEKKPKDKFTFKPGVDNEDDFKELILEWGNSIINKAFEDVDSKNSKEPEYKCLRFGDFKYVQRILPEETKIDSLASIVLNAMKQMTTENIEQLSNKILRFLNT